ncbi:MAG: hypothetical protein IAE98_03170 [Candidatus Kapabacteria bacterium]|nr:hypothetical protein [Candidatus Kapabacteria bacterium]
MKITKDEAIILAQAIGEQKYEFNDSLSTDKAQRNLSIGAFTDLEKRLSDYGKDKRRQGRTSKNHFSDILKRFVAKHSPKEDKK